TGEAAQPDPDRGEPNGSVMDRGALVVAGRHRPVLLERVDGPLRGAAGAVGAGSGPRSRRAGACRPPVRPGPCAVSGADGAGHRRPAPAGAGAGGGQAGAATASTSTSWSS